MTSSHAQRSDVKHKLLDLLSWLALAAVFFLVLRLLGPFTMIAQMGNVPVAQEGKAMLEIMCFVAGLSAIIVGISHVFSKDFREEAANLQAPVAQRVERRHERHARVGLLMILGLAFSLAGLVALLLPINDAEKAMSPVLQMAFVGCFGLMTLLTAGAATLAIRRQRLFDRRR